MKGQPRQRQDSAAPNKKNQPRPLRPRAESGDLFIKGHRNPHANEGRNKTKDHIEQAGVAASNGAKKAQRQQMKLEINRRSPGIGTERIPIEKMKAAVEELPGIGHVARLIVLDETREGPAVAAQIFAGIENDDGKQERKTHPPSKRGTTNETHRHILRITRPRDN